MLSGTMDTMRAKLNTKGPSYRFSGSVLKNFAVRSGTVTHWGRYETRHEAHSRLEAHSPRLFQKFR